MAPDEHLSGVEHEPSRPERCAQAYDCACPLEVSVPDFCLTHGHGPYHNGLTLDVFAPLRHDTHFFSFLTPIVRSRLSSLHRCIINPPLDLYYCNPVVATTVLYYCPDTLRYLDAMINRLSLN